MSENMSANGNIAAEPAVEAPPTKVDKTEPQHRPVEASEMLRSDAGDVKAEHVTMDRSGAETITADRVSMDRSGTRRLDAKSAHLENSGAMFMRADNAVFYGGAAIAVSTRQAKIVHSNFGALRAGDSTTIEGQVNALLYAGPADEKIKPVFTAGSGAAFGAAVAVTLMLLGRILRRIVGRG